MRRWLADLRRFDGRGEAILASEEDAFARLRGAHPGVEADVLRSRVVHLTRRDEAGRLVWRYDVLHRCTSPMPFFAATYRAFAACVTCPVLYVSGGATGYHPPDEAERIAAFPDVRTLDLEGAGHMMHWTRPMDLTSALLDFASSS